MISYISDLFKTSNRLTTGPPTLSVNTDRQVILMLKHCYYGLRNTQRVNSGKPSCTGLALVERPRIKTKCHILILMWAREPPQRLVFFSFIEAWRHTIGLPLPYSMTLDINSYYQPSLCCFFPPSALQNSALLCCDVWVMFCDFWGFL